MSELLDNRAHRIRTLKHVIKHLHAGDAPEQVREQLKQLVRECDAGEIAQMEQELIAEGVPVHEIMGMCDLHSQVVSEVLVERAAPKLAPGHPAQTFRSENAALEQHVEVLREALDALKQPADGDGDRPSTESVIRCRALANELMDIEKHYQRKEHLLFSMLERHGITGPSTVMWGKDDEVRELVKSLHEAILQEDVSCEEWAIVHTAVAEPAFEAVREMIFKEERILLPMSLQTLTEVEWGQIWQQSPQFGWCLVSPESGYQPPEEDAAGIPGEVRDRAKLAGVALNIISPAEAASDAKSTTTSRPAKVDGSIVFPTGSLTLEQLKAIFGALPCELTFVDSEDRVRFTSEGRNKVFARPLAVIGRKVQHCHPPGSVHIVDQILDDFRSGRQSVADFWISFKGRFVFIRYFALRNESGEYVGTLEVTQDLSRERELNRERRLLQYDSPGDIS
ncbi:MAG: hypothetical protein CMJ58_28875 [Planctomycetaceae bacterium]|nr:hypothetical protein [Planctomycetaceae bacterium]